ncbi:dual specificity protein phosphatase 26 [Ambystoma mexicanum]|uniref:dual specificity protein phosphatase 26 n=1 Tax=Ambystoma mexicanum TaxID=8296 RepID=UPI0037E88A8F
MHGGTERTASQACHGLKIAIQIAAFFPCQEPQKTWLPGNKAPGAALPHTDIHKPLLQGTCYSVYSSKTPRSTRQTCDVSDDPGTMAFMSRFSRSSSRSPSRRSKEDSSPPVLSIFELERLLYTGRTASNHADEVWPSLYLGDQDIAADRRELSRLCITHVLNASHSRFRGGSEYYDGMNITYRGIEAHDSPTFDMSIHFQSAADFIHQALRENKGKILVHCAVGVSRSATLVLAYLMLHHQMTLVEAIKTVKAHRGIIPNRGFLRQLVSLDNSLRVKRKI